MPSIIKTSPSVFGGIDDTEESNDGQKDKDSGTPGFKLPGQPTSLLDHPVN